MRGKRCQKCGKTKSSLSFGPRKDVKDGLRSWCRECTRCENRASYKRNKEIRLLGSWKYQLKMRKKVISMLGGECRRCGETDIRILQINHIDGGGRQERLSKTRHFYLKDIIDGSRNTDDLEILCANHNILYEYESGRWRQ